VAADDQDERAADRQAERDTGGGLRSDQKRCVEAGKDGAHAEIERLEGARLEPREDRPGAASGR